MRMRAALGLLALAAAPPAGAAPRAACQPTVVRRFASCVGAAARALGACARRRGRLCATDRRAARAVARLGRAVRGRCRETAIRDAGHPPPFEPSVLAARLEAACLGNAAALVGRAVDAVGADRATACAAALGAASARLAVRSLRLRGACALAGGCDDGRLAARIAKATRRARRSALRRCRARVGSGAVDAVLARAGTQAACALASAVPDAGACAPAGPEAVTDLWRLPVPRPAGTRAAQISSYDRTGGNADLGVGPDTVGLLAALALPAVESDFSYLYREGDRYVVFDEPGPGVVWRIWMTGLDGLITGGLRGDVAFELDDEPAARLRLDRKDLFAGASAPFLAPLAGDLAASSGGFYSVVPVPFARRLRITTSTVPNWLQITYSRLPPDQAVASFDPTRDTAALAARLARAGDPETTVAPTAVDEAALVVAPGTTGTVWSRAGPATIVRLELLGPAGADVPLGLRLRATFDGASAAQVDAPLDDLFGAALGAGARGFAFGRDGDRWYCWFPMPFRSAARLELANDGAAPFAGWTLRVGSVDALPPGAPTHLHATAASAHLAPDGADYVLLDAPGAGHVVGVVLTAGCAEAGRCQLDNLPGLDGAHLEGDERIALDGSRWPQIHGTGLEDFFSGGFYFIRGAFGLPTHGNPAQAPATSPRRPGLNLRSAYRLFLGDAIPFEAGARLAIEHGPTDDVPADFSSLVFWYAGDAATLVETDRLVLGDAASEAAHELAAEGRADVTLTSAFRGDASDVPVTASGMTAGVTRFRVAVRADNHGVRLRRLMDLAGGRQAARVLVDGAFAGVWRTSEVNPFLRWAEVDFEIPPALSLGRDALAIEVDARDSPAPWTAFEYAAFVHER